MGFLQRRLQNVPSKISKSAGKLSNMVTLGDGTARRNPPLGMGVSGEGAGPGDVAMAGGIAGVVAFGKDPTSALIDLAEGEEIGSDVLLASGKAFLSGGELIHERETKVVLLAGEV